MKMRPALSNFIIISFVFLVISDCKKAKEEVPYAYQYHPCQYAKSVWIGMMINGQYPGDGDFISTSSIVLRWVHPWLGLYTGNMGCKYDVYLGTKPEVMSKYATDQIKDTITLTGLVYNQTYYWKIVANYDWFDYKGARCSNITETETLSFSTYQKNDLPKVITAPVAVVKNIQPRVGGTVRNN